MILNKACDVGDFAAADMRAILRKWFGSLKGNEEPWPIGHEDRKFWEIGMTLLAVDTYIPSESRRMALGVGAGIEATNFILSNLFRWVFITDLYGRKGWLKDAPGRMLIEPEAFSPSIGANVRRMVVQHMDGKTLRYEDNTFDLVYSSSAIEHFGDRDAIASAAREMGRVLRPGGILSLSTELLLSGDSQWLGGHTFLFTQPDLFALIIEPSGCVPVGEHVFQVSTETVNLPTRFSDALGDLEHIVNRYEDRWSSYPHVVLTTPEASWTSAQITLRKP